MRIRGINTLVSFERHLRLGHVAGHQTYTREVYAFARSFLVAPIVSGYGSKPDRDEPTWLEERNASRFPLLNRRGNAAGRYCVKASHVWNGKPTLVGQMSESDAAQYQDRMTQLRQFAAIAGISISGKDYSKAVTCKATGKRTDSKGAMFDCTHASRWNGGKYDAAAAKRAAQKLALAADRAIYPWLYDARGKRREPQIDAAGVVAFGPRGRTVSVADLMSHQRSVDCAVDCETDTMARSIRHAQYLRNGGAELEALIAAQREDMKAQKRGKMAVTVAELTA